MSLQAEYANATATLQKVVDAIEAKIMSLPDNPRITRLSPQAFTISSKDLGNNWSPEHHDFKRQYRIIVDAIKRANVGRALIVLKEIIDKQVVVIGGRQNLRLHPDVVQYLTTLLVEDGGE